MGLFFLQDSRGLVGDNLMFWSAGGNGYTSDLRKSARFSKSQAEALHRGRISDIPWPADYLMARFYIAVDMQYLRDVDKNSRDVAFYRQIPGYYIGNDVVWEAVDGKSTDLRKDRVFSENCDGSIMWSVEEIQKIARPVVRAMDVSIKDALKESGIVLQKPTKPKRETITCGGCGRFLSEAQLWSGECPKCGTDNRP